MKCEMSRKVILAAILFGLLSACFSTFGLSTFAAHACTPDQSLMQDTCYGSCANYAMLLKSQCKETCNLTHCTGDGVVFGSCGSEWSGCNGRCDNEACHGLGDCQSFCVPWSVP